MSRSEHTGKSVMLVILPWTGHLGTEAPISRHSSGDVPKLYRLKRALNGVGGVRVDDCPREKAPRHSTPQETALPRSACPRPSRKRSWRSGNGGCRDIGNSSDNARAGGGPLTQAARRVLPNGGGELRPSFRINRQEEHLQGLVVADICSVTTNSAPW